MDCRNYGGGVKVNLDTGETYTDHIELFHEIEKKFDTRYDDYWKSQKNWSVNQIFPERYQKQQKFYKDNFVIHLDKTQRVCDLASANGEWSIDVSKYVKWVDGYEYSNQMVDFAKASVRQMGIENVSFYQGDAREIIFNQIYDNFMMMGLLTCIFGEDDARDIIKKVYQALCKGGRLIVKDSLNMVKENSLYHYNIESGYKAIYRAKEKYFQLFKEAGFELEQETVLHETISYGLKFQSVGAVWIKMD